MVEVNVDRLKALRHQRVLTLRELEQRSGVAYKTIWHLGSGKRGAQPRTLRKLARALNVEPEELVKTEGYSFLPRSPPSRSGPSSTPVSPQPSKPAQPPL